MKTQNMFLLGCTLALTSVSAMAESTPTPYHYGMRMDVHKVIAMTEPHTHDCKVVEARIKFLDKAGDEQHVSYSKLSEACLFQN